MNLTLIKETPDYLTLNGVGMSPEVFLFKMGHLGFDLEVTFHGLRCLRIGGKWSMNMKPSELKFLTGETKDKRSGGKGFKN